ncbi:MAG: hypothetical protein LBQ52_08830, partial [Helicobacteraceae bacterium]|nr:hypothetical protein [Helicobacteraceae bacterium]
ESFDEFDVAKAVEKLDYPSLIFGVKDDRIEVSFDYMVSKENSDQILCVKMDDRLNVTGFSHES